MFSFCDFLSRHLQLKHYRYILLQSDSEQRLIGTKWKQQDGGCEEVIKTSAPGASAALWTDEYEP